MARRKWSARDERETAKRIGTTLRLRLGRESLAERVLIWQAVEPLTDLAGDRYAGVRQDGFFMGLFDKSEADAIGELLFRFNTTVDAFAEALEKVEGIDREKAEKMAEDSVMIEATSGWSGNPLAILVSTEAGIPDPFTYPEAQELWDAAMKELNKEYKAYWDSINPGVQIIYFED